MSFTLSIGQPAPDFDLPGVDGKRHALRSFAGCRALVVVFSCNHCPYVIGSEDRMVKFALEYAPHGVAFVAINSNETDNHPADSWMLGRSAHSARVDGFQRQVSQPEIAPL